MRICLFSSMRVSHLIEREGVLGVVEFRGDRCRWLLGSGVKDDSCVLDQACEG